MDLVREKIRQLDSKMDELQQIVRDLCQQISILTPILEQNQNNRSQPESTISCLNDEYTGVDMEHKDILVGGNTWQYHSYRYKQMGMTTEVEIRRLTAQLTAAYNRIAALEEQLLSKNQKNVENKSFK